MNEEIKTQWVAALRSGDYQQGQNALRDSSDRYCCLGVLCELAVKAGVIAEPSQYDGDRDYLFDGKTAFPSSVVNEWAGTYIYGRGDPTVPTADGQGIYLSTLNDKGYSFDAIADLIEENL